MAYSNKITLNSGTYYFEVSGYDGVYIEDYGKYSFSIGKALPAPASVKLNRGTLGLGTGEVYGLLKTISPSNANQSATWTSSNTSVATVDSNGKVTGRKTGTATVTVRTSNGKTASCKVTVKYAPASVSTNPAKLALAMQKSAEENQEFMLRAQSADMQKRMNEAAEKYQAETQKK